MALEANSAKETDPIQNHLPKVKIIATLVTAAISFTAAVIIWQQQGLDNTIVIQHNFIYDNPFLLKIFQLISGYGMGFIALIYGVLAFLSFKFEKLTPIRPLLMFMLFGFAFASIAGDLLKEVFSRPRPAFALTGQIANTYISNSWAFPSGHATKSLALALPYVIAATGKNLATRALKFTVLINALLVSYSRIALQRHYLSDILGALGVALLFVPLTHWFANYIFRQNKLDQVQLDIMTKRLGVVFLALSIVLSLL